MHKVVKEGYVVVTPCMIGPDSIWRESGQDNIQYPAVFPTPKDAWKSIVEDYVLILEEFLQDERELEDTELSGPEEYVLKYKEYDNGDFHLMFDDGEIIRIENLKMWRENL